MKRISVLKTLLLPAVLAVGTPGANAAVRPDRDAIRKAKHQATMTMPKKAPAIQAAASLTGVNFLGYLCYSDYSNLGLYSISGTNFRFSYTADLNASGGGTYGNGKYYAVDMDNFPDGPAQLSVYDANSWQLLNSAENQSASSVSADLTFDPTQNEVYGIFFDGDYSIFWDPSLSTGLGLLNTETGRSTLIGDSFAERMVAIACNADGQLYGISISGDLYAINKTNARTTLIGATGVTPDCDMQSAVIDYNTGKMYWSAVYDDYTTGLLEVDLSTGRASQVKEWTDSYGYPTMDMVNGLSLKQDIQTSGIPDKATGLAAQFATGMLSGTFSFTLPSADIAGNQLSGTLDYAVTAGEISKSGSAKAGSTVNVPMTLPSAGAYTFSVTVSAAGQTGPATSIEKWIGYDEPKWEGTPTTRPDGNDGSAMIIDWTESVPVSGIHGESIGRLTFDVVRYPDVKTVATGISATTCTDKIDSNVRTEYSYKITAKTNGGTSATASTNTIIYGTTWPVPFNEDFSQPGVERLYTVADVNKDGSTWKFENGAFVYGYNQKNNANDWLITPPVRLETGKLYTFSFHARNSYPDERICASFGTAATPEAMTTQLVAPIVISGFQTQAKPETNFSVNTTGDYYFGIHACSDADASDLYLYGITVKAVPVTAPSCPRNLTVTPGSQGASEATLTFDMPSTSINGDRLSGNLDVNIYRNDSKIATLNSLTPGAGNITWKDENIDFRGLYTYKVVAVNTEGEGEYATETAFIGIDVPGPVRNLTAKEDPTSEGNIIVTWDAPEKGVNGGYINPDELTYYISPGLGGDEINNGRSTIYRDNLNATKSQIYQGYNVWAENASGSGRQNWSTVTTIAGPALKLPVYESFANQTQRSGPWLNKMIAGEIGEAFWFISDGTISSSGTQDSDAGIMLFSASATGCASRIETPKIDIRGAKNPYLTFWAYLTGKNDRLEVMLSREFGEFSTVLTIPMNSAPKGWKRFELPLSEYADARFIQAGFAAFAVEATDYIIAIDNISVRDLVDHDLELMTLTAPSDLKVGQKGEFTVSVRNVGRNDAQAGSYTVNLIKNGKTVATAAGKAVNAESQVSFTMNDTPTIDDSEETIYTASLTYEADQNPDNNTSTGKRVRIELPVYPSVTDLDGEITANGISLSWSEPNIADMPAKPVTETFESYASFIISGIGDWTLVDGDGLKTIQMTLSGLDDPLQYDNVGKPMAFQVFNPEKAAIPFATWDPHSGKQMLAAFRPTDGVNEDIPNDDWLISPELSGKAQTITFYAKPGASIPETIEVLYSETGHDVDDFIYGSEPFIVADVRDWEQFRIMLPDGAKYFAIHCISDSPNHFALLVDDITYTPAGALPEEVSLMGYNVYRDGRRLNSEPISESVFDDNDVELENTYKYKVTSVYDKGESLYSNEYTVLYTHAGLGSVEITRITVQSDSEGLVIKGAEGKKIDVYTLSGINAYSGIGDNVTRVSLPKGIYAISIDGHMFKHAVR